MSYEIDIDLQAQDDIAALPAMALPALAEAMTVLELTRGTAARSTRTTPTVPSGRSPSAPPGC
jgi:hypothetical protein